MESQGRLSSQNKNSIGYIVTFERIYFLPGALWTTAWEKELGSWVSDRVSYSRFNVIRLQIQQKPAHTLQPVIRLRAPPTPPRRGCLWFGFPGMAGGPLLVSSCPSTTVLISHSLGSANNQHTCKMYFFQGSLL